MLESASATVRARSGPGSRGVVQEAPDDAGQGQRSTPTHLLTFHVERLYDDRAWRRFHRTLQFLGRRGIRSTCFVFPPLHPRHTSHASFGADGEAKFVERLRIVAALGHEIEQHTHIYHPERKEFLHTPANIRRAVGGEKAYLERLGYRIRGFLSGGFNISSAIIRELGDFGFRYDCSMTTFPKPFESCTLPLRPRPGDGPMRLENGMIELPTTHTLKMMLTEPNGGSGRYRQIYAHDYDFLRLGSRLAVRAVILRHGSSPWSTVGQYLGPEHAHG